MHDHCYFSTNWLSVYLFSLYKCGRIQPISLKSVLNEIVASLRPTHVTKGTYKLLVITATEALTD